LTEAIHFVNDVHPGVALLRGLDAFRRNQWMLSIGITGGLRWNTQAGPKFASYGLNWQYAFQSSWTAV